MRRNSSEVCPSGSCATAMPRVTSSGDFDTTPSTGSPPACVSVSSLRTRVSSTPIRMATARPSTPPRKPPRRGITRLARGELELRHDRVVDHLRGDRGLPLRILGSHVLDGHDELVGDGVRQVGRCFCVIRDSGDPERDSALRDRHLDVPGQSTRSGVEVELFDDRIEHARAGGELSERQHLALRIHRSLVEVGGAGSLVESEIQGGRRLEERRLQRRVSVGPRCAENGGQHDQPPELAQRTRDDTQTDPALAHGFPIPLRFRF